MIRLTITPKKKVNLYGLLVKKEVALAKANRGTLYRSGGKHKNREKWAHLKYPGWIWFQRCTGEVVAVKIQSRREGAEGSLMDSFLGFVYRHFRKSLVCVIIHYDE